MHRTTPGPRRSLRTALVASLVMAVAITVGVGPAGAATRPAPVLKDPAVTARQLVTRYLTILEEGDTAALARFLDPAFQLQRADGTGADRTEYLANPATVTSFTIPPQIDARQHGDVLTVRWSVEVDSVIDGVMQRRGDAPRLSTFRWSGDRWRLISHGNFNLPA